QVKEAFVEAMEDALALGDLDQAGEVLAMVGGLRPGERAPSTDAQLARLRARLAMAEGSSDGVEVGLKEAAGLFRELGMPFWLAVTHLELGEWLAGRGRAGDAGPLFDQAREIFERLRATPWLERLGRAAVAAPE